MKFLYNLFLSNLISSTKGISILTEHEHLAFSVV